MEPYELHSFSQEKRPMKCYSKTRLFLIIDSKTPLVMKLPLPPHLVTLKHFRELVSLEEDRYKFYFNSRDTEHGFIKEEILEDDLYLPYEGDKIVAWAINRDNPNTERRVIPGNTTHRTSGFSHDSRFNSRRCINIKVHLHLDQFNFLGLTLISRSSRNSSKEDGALYVAGIAKQSVIEQNGLIELGDKLIEINDVNLEGLTDKNAIAIIQRLVQKRGPITIQVSREIGDVNLANQISYPSLLPSINDDRFNLSPGAPQNILDYRLTDIFTIYLVLKKDAQSLGLKNYDWLGVIIKNAFLGSSLINWLRRNVDGFKSKRGIKKFADELLKSNLIKSPIAYNTFSERCFYALN